MKIPRVSCLLVKIQHLENLLVQRFPAGMTTCRDEFMGGECCLEQRDFSLNRTRLLVVDFSVEFSGSRAPCVPLDAQFLLSSPVPQAQGPCLSRAGEAGCPSAPISFPIQWQWSLQGQESTKCGSSGFCGNLGSGAVLQGERSLRFGWEASRGPFSGALMMRSSIGAPGRGLTAACCPLCCGRVGWMATRHLAKPVINFAHL